MKATLMGRLRIYRRVKCFKSNWPHGDPIQLYKQFIVRVPSKLLCIIYCILLTPIGQIENLFTLYTRREKCRSVSIDIKWWQNFSFARYPNATFQLYQSGGTKCSIGSITSSQTTLSFSGTIDINQSVKHICLIAYHELKLTLNFLLDSHLSNKIFMRAQIFIKNRRKHENRGKGLSK